MNNNLQLGERIKLFRVRSGLSQSDLELEMGASYGSISKIENGKVNPTKETIFKLGKVMNLTSSEVSYLFGIIQITEFQTLDLIHKNNNLTKETSEY